MLKLQLFKTVGWKTEWKPTWCHFNVGNSQPRWIICWEHDNKKKCSQKYSCLLYFPLLCIHARQIVSCPVQPRACHWCCVLWRNFSGVKRTCWTTGSWGSCLSLEVVSSIPAGSTIIYRFLCGFICVSLCQSIKIKPTNMYGTGLILGLRPANEIHHYKITPSLIGLAQT